MKSDRTSPHEVVLPRRAMPPAAGSTVRPPVALFGSAPGTLESLRKLSLAVVGCGSVGGRIALHLARMGFGGLLLVDPKSYKPASLSTHEIGPADVGQPKAVIVSRRCKAVSPATRVLAFAGPVEALDLVVLADVDLVVMAPDLLAVEVEVGQRCLWLGKPLVQASVHGPTLTVQIRFFHNAKAGGGCPVCGYGRCERDLMTRQVRFSCDGAMGNGAPSLADAPATNSLSALSSLGADLAVTQILRFLLKVGHPVEDTLLQTCGFTHQTVITPIARNPSCPLDHSMLAQASVDVSLASLSLAQLTQRVTGAPIAADARFEVAGLDWVELAACGCARPVPVRRFVPRGRAELSHCGECSAPRVPLGFYTHRAVSASVLGAAVEQPLRQIGGRRVSSVLLRTGETGVLIRTQPSLPSKS